MTDAVCDSSTLAISEKGLGEVEEEVLAEKGLGEVNEEVLAERAKPKAASAKADEFSKKAEAHDIAFASLEAEVAVVKELAEKANDAAVAAASGLA